MAVPTHYQALAAYLGEHVDAEEHALTAYEELLEGRPDDVVTYIVGMILADEERHHEIFGEFRDTLTSRMRWEQTERVMPSTRIDGDVTELLRTTEELLSFERMDAKELKGLRKRWERQPGERKLWALLVRTAELDTEKHIRMLEYLRDLLRDAA
ncbi:MAG: hypothetical protein ACR2O6_04770 [Ilumatobacteraceae bacterium]